MNITVRKKQQLWYVIWLMIFIDKAIWKSENNMNWWQKTAAFTEQNCDAVMGDDAFNPTMPAIALEWLVPQNGALSNPYSVAPKSTLALSVRK